MGSLCSKESTPDPFAQPGRALSSAAPPQNKPTATAPVPRIVGGPPRTLGGGGGGGAPGTGTGLQTDSQREDARRKAAEAAQARAQAANKPPRGKLGAQLLDQRKQTRADTLDAASREERRLREADEAGERRAYN